MPADFRRVYEPWTRFEIDNSGLARKIVRNAVCVLNKACIREDKHIGGYSRFHFVASNC